VADRLTGRESAGVVGGHRILPMEPCPRASWSWNRPPLPRHIGQRPYLVVQPLRPQLR
jgi:hypothetical protein